MAGDCRDYVIPAQPLFDLITKYTTGLRKYNQPIVANIQYILDQSTMKVYPVLMSGIGKDVERYVASITTNILDFAEGFDNSTYSPFVLISSSDLPFYALLTSLAEYAYSDLHIDFNDFLKTQIAAENCMPTVKFSITEEGLLDVTIFNITGDDLTTKHWEYSALRYAKIQKSPFEWASTFSFGMVPILSYLLQNQPALVYNKEECEVLFVEINTLSPKKIDIHNGQHIIIPIYKDFIKQKPSRVEIYANKSFYFDDLPVPCVDVCLNVEYSGNIRHTILYRVIDDDILASS